MKVSIVMPVYNEENYIGVALDSILQQNYKDDVELLVVDGGSTDQTSEIIEDYIRRYPQIKLLQNPNKITPSAMNVGIKNATGDLIVRVDAHAHYSPDYISKCVEWSIKTDAENVGGLAYATGRGFWGKVIEFAHYSPFGLGGASFRMGNYEGYADTVFGGAFKKEVFNRVGYYNEHLERNQDIELNSRIVHSGGKCYLTPEIKSKYFCRSNIKDLWKQNYANGLWGIYTIRISKNALSLRHFVPLLFVMGLNIAGVLAMMGHFLFEDFYWWTIGPFCLFTGSYMFTAFYFACRIAVQKGFRYLGPLMAVFATLHLSYGWGSIIGLFTVSRWAKTKDVV